MAAAGMMALRGNALGTLRISGGEAVLALRTRRAEPALAFFVLTDGGVYASRVSKELRCGAPEGPVCAAAIFDGSAKLLCSGSLGSCGSMLSKKLSELRMRAASELLRRDSTAAEAVSEIKTEAPHENRSAVTEEIIKKARELFSAEHAESAAPPPPLPAGTEPARADIEAVPNPFPRSYPNSYWQRAAGQSFITGTAHDMRGAVILLRATPARRGRRPMGYERYITANDGRGWWVHEQRQ